MEEHEKPERLPWGLALVLVALGVLLGGTGGAIFGYEGESGDQASLLSLTGGAAAVVYGFAGALIGASCGVVAWALWVGLRIFRTHV